MRPHNRRLVLQLLRANGPLTRPAIAAVSGLSAAAVSNVVAELVGDGLVAEQAPELRAGDDRRPVGRPAGTVALAVDSHCVLAVQIGAVTIQLCVAGIDARIHASDSFDIAPGQPAEEVLDEIAAALLGLLDRCGRTTADVLGIGVGAAGLVDRSGRTNVVAVNAGWSDVPMADLLEARLGVPATIDHNVRAMAMGEARYGHGVDIDSLVYVYARTGLGIGLVLDGRPYRGGRLGSHEIGHVQVPGGDICTCGKRGCVETIVSDRALIRQLRDAGLTTAADLDEATTAAFIAAVVDEVPAALDVRDRIVSALATALAVVVELVDPHVIVLGGLLDDCGVILREPLHREVANRLTPWMRSELRIVPTAFGATSGLVGAATLALDTYLFGITPLRESGVDARVEASTRAIRALDHRTTATVSARAST